MIEKFDIPKILKNALKNGGDFAELFEEHSTRTQIHRENKRFEKAQFGTDRGVGLRILYREKTAYGFTNEITEKALLHLADHLAAAIRAEAFHQNISLKIQTPLWNYTVQLDPAQVSIQSKTKILLEADRTAWDVAPQIQQVTTRYGDQLREIRIANSLGQMTHEKQNYVVFIMQVVAREGEIVESAYEPLGGMSGFEILDDSKACELATTVAKRAVTLLKAPLAPSGPMTVVVSSEAGGTMVHEAVGHGLEADLAREGLSVYQDQLGERVANPLITVIDDPTLPGKRGSFLFDDEGTPAQRNVLIDRGVLKTFLYNRLYAMKDGVASTGNGRRESYQHRPIVRMTNTMIAPGESDPESIVRSVDKGLLVTRMGSGQVNTVNGDFVFEVSEGFILKNGKIDHPVRGATLTGNGPEVLNSIDKVGSDLGFGLGTCGKDGQGVPVADAQPTLRIPQIIVGGHLSSKIQE